VSGPIGIIFRHFCEGAEGSSCLVRYWNRDAYNISMQLCRFITLLSYSCSYVSSGYVGKNIQVFLGNVIVKTGMKAWLSFIHFSFVLVEACDRVRVGV